jgi:hypothetical protein
MNDKIQPNFYRALLLIAQFNDKFLELASLLHELHQKELNDFKTLISIPQLGRLAGERATTSSKSTERSVITKTRLRD